MERKPDADEIASYLDELARQLRRPSSNDNRSRWLDYLFHITHIEAAVAALADGQLLSRTRLEREGRMGFDAAAPEIIARTQPAVRDKIRLYFRPLNPTFFHSEGIRTVADQSDLGSHCPVPVAFLFDKRTVLGRAGTIWSNGNASSPRARFGSDAASLRALPFTAIYHNEPNPTDDIVFHRCAEVLVPGSLPFPDCLSAVRVRSQGEYETFRSLLMERTADDWGERLRRVGVNRRGGLFFKQWTYVEDAVALGDRIRIHFNPSTESPGPYAATFRFEDVTTGQSLHVDTVVPFFADRRWDQTLPPAARQTPFRFSLYLDEHLAYRNLFSPPFDHRLIRPTRA